jgi:hypothetical protein
LRLNHLEIELGFAQEFKSFSISQQLYKALTGKPSDIEESIEPGVVFRSPKKRQMVDWDTDSCHIIMESIASYDECLNKMAALLETVNKVAPINALSTRKLITHWILPIENYTFKTLEEKYRKIFFTQKSIWTNTFDSSVLIDMKVKGLILHHQSGAMGRKQLRQDFASFKLDNIPSVFLFLWASIENNKIIKYSNKDINLFLTTSFQHCKHHSEVFEDIWRQNL